MNGIYTMTDMNRQELIDRLVRCYFEEEEKLKTMTDKELKDFLDKREHECPDLYPDVIE